MFKSFIRVRNIKLNMKIEGLLKEKEQIEEELERYSKSKVEIPSLNSFYSQLCWSCEDKLIEIEEEIKKTGRKLKKK